ncbi:MAG: YihY/virulence factor BrkB family protein [Atopobiaceae bacterium]|nr:YihY/virulence factor BrkB family protein [Atopobiaceae bacterium]
MSASTHASSIAYYTFFSIVPLLALCISLVSLVGVSEQAVYDTLFSLVPEALEDLARTIVSDAYERSGLAFSLSTLSLLWSASKGVKALRAGLNSAYGQKETRNAVAVAAISIASVVVMGLLIAAAMWMVFGHSLLHALSQYVPGIQLYADVLEFADLVGTLTIGVLLIALCYTHLPAGHRRLKSQLPGAVCTLVGCGVLSFGFRLYVDHVSSYTVLYGSIATIAMLLFWMYLVFYIVIAGGFVNRILLEQPDVRR